MMARNMGCEAARSRLNEYADGALVEKEAWDVEAHLRACAVCERVAAELSATARLLRTLPREDTSPSFEDALARRLADVVLRPRRRGLWERLVEAAPAWTARPAARRPALAVAAAGLAVLVPAVFAGRARLSSQPERPVASLAAAAAGDTQFLEQMVDEHASYAPSEPLGDAAAAIILASSTRAAAASGDGAGR
jgi:anti-sigma factor RsiW